jgi:hypothetical protein
MKGESEGQNIRFEGTVHAEAEGAAARAVAELDLDRIPGSRDEVRVLVNAEDLARLLERGVEVRLIHAHPVRPLHRSLIIDDDASRSLLEERTRGVERRGRP